MSDCASSRLRTHTHTKWLDGDGDDDVFASSAAAAASAAFGVAVVPPLTQYISVAKCANSRPRAENVFAG